MSWFAWCGGQEGSGIFDLASIQEGGTSYSIFLSTYGIFFFGTSHDGSQSPWMCLAAPNSKTQAHTQSITAKHSEILQNISDQFAPLIKQFYVRCFWEEKNTVTSTWTGRFSSRAFGCAHSERYRTLRYLGYLLQDVQIYERWINRVSSGTSNIEEIYPRLQELIATRWEHAFKALERLRRNEASEILDTNDPSQNSPIIYEKHDRTYETSTSAFPTMRAASLPEDEISRKDLKKASSLVAQRNLGLCRRGSLCTVTEVQARHSFASSSSKTIDRGKDIVVQLRRSTPLLT